MDSESKNTFGSVGARSPCGALYVFINLIIFQAAILCGCQNTSLIRREIRDQISAAQSTAHDFSLRPMKSKLPNPFKLAFYFKSPKGEFKWTESDKKGFIAIVEDLQRQQVISKVFFLESNLSTGEDLSSIRKAASDQGADALLLIEGGAAIERGVNPWGWSYVLLLPTLFVKGSHAETFFSATATLWSVKDESFLTSAEAEADHRESYIAAFGSSDKTLIAKTKDHALENLNFELKRIFKSTKSN